MYARSFILADTYWVLLKSFPISIRHVFRPSFTFPTLDPPYWPTEVRTTSDPQEFNAIDSVVSSGLFAFASTSAPTGMMVTNTGMYTSCSPTWTTNLGHQYSALSYGFY